MEARARSAELVRSRLKPNTILTGDFNALPTEPPYGTLIEGCVDTYLEVHGQESGGTVHTFTLPVQVGGRIDWVLVSPGTEVLDATIETAIYDGHYPSDHFAVTATLRPPP